MTDKQVDPVLLLADLVAIDSVNPDLVAGAAGEGAIADFCAGWLARQGLDVHRLEQRPGRPSIVAVAKGAGGGRSLMLNGHLDTVTLAGFDGDPLQPRQEHGRLYGRGSFDMKGGLAAMMVAAARASQMGLSGDVLVACVADEESASFGTEEVLASFGADAAIVTEPSGLEITLAHKGFVWFEVTVTGRAAHGSRPDLGVDAIVKAGHFLVSLEEWGRDLAAGPAHPALGTGTVHASLIEGGEEASSYPATCRVTLERRTVPGETPAMVEAELAGLLEALRAKVPDFSYRLKRALAREAFEADPEAEIVKVVARQVERVVGAAPAVRAEAFWTDCALLQAAGIPCLLFGAGGEGAHSAVEWADIDSVGQATDVLTAVIAEFCA